MAAIENITPEQKAELHSLVVSLNEKLESAVQASTNHAFNVGCSVSFIPLTLLVVLVLVFTRLNWVVALVAAAFALLAALGLATLVAFTARKNASEQTYRLRIYPEIDRSLAPLDLTRPDFDRLANSILPAGALLRNYLSAPEADEPGATGEERNSP